MMGVITLSVVMLSDVMLGVDMLSFVGPPLGYATGLTRKRTG
jgi:hypothetical protein